MIGRGADRAPPRRRAAASSSDGIAVLVEKPMARSLGGGRRAARGGRAHRARRSPSATPSGYNPAVAAVLPLVTSPRFIEVHRLGVFSGSQPRHRRGVRLDDSRPGHHSGARSFGRRIDRSGRRAGADARSSTSPTPGSGSPPAASPTSPPAGSAATGCGRSASSSPTPTSRSTTPRRRPRAGGWCRARAAGRPIEGGPLPVERDEPLRRELADFVARSARREPPRSSTATPAAGRSPWRPRSRRR